MPVEFDPTIPIITIHGIGNGSENYVTKWHVADTLEVDPALVRSFYYENLNDADHIGQLVKMTISSLTAAWGTALAVKGMSVPADYLSDLFVFFLSSETRSIIENKLKAILDTYTTVRIFGHSLGAVIGYWFCMNNPEYAGRIHLVTLGCPLGSRILGGMCRLMTRRITPGTERPGVLSWVNIYSALDPVSGEVEGLGCDHFDQFRVPPSEFVFHSNVHKYIAQFKRFITKA